MFFIEDLRDSYEEFNSPLNKNLKKIVFSIYLISFACIVACIACGLFNYYINKKTSDQLHLNEIYAQQIESASGAIVFNRDCRVEAQKIQKWIAINLPIQSMLVDILELIPAELKVKNLSTVISSNKNQLELILDISGKKNEILKLTKDIEQKLNQNNCRFISSSSLDLLYGSRVIITSNIES